MSAMNEEPREAALAAFNAVSRTTTGLLEYRSGGSVAVIGNQERLLLASQLRAPLSVAALISTDADGGDNVITLHSEEIGIEGYLGNFRLHVTGAEGAKAVESDLILDLGEWPQLTMPTLPPGYVAWDGQTTIDALNNQLVELTGSFDKPEYFRYDADKCAHARNGMTACTRCIDACPAEAIHSLLERVEVDPYLCQGGGVCASACPSGAITYAYPRPGDLNNALRAMLRAYHQAGGSAPTLLFHAQDSRLPESLSLRNDLLPVAVEELASVGIDSWLAALAWGASQVVLYREVELSPRVQQELSAQLQLAAELLAGLGYPSAAVALGPVGEIADEEAAAMPEIKAATQAAMHDKRTGIYMALDHLAAEAAKSRRLVTLSNGAPFGEASVDSKRCTLCMACASVCPGHALQDGQGEPKLRFVEANCIQCGLCTRTCPEDAIWITPRFLFDRQARNEIRVLHEEEPFNCVTCGKPFATKSVIDSISAKLADNWMFQDERAKQRLLMCDDCRVVDVVQDAQAMGIDQPQRQ